MTFEVRKKVGGWCPQANYRDKNGDDYELILGPPFKDKELAHQVLDFWADYKGRRDILEREFKRVIKESSEVW